MDMPTPRQSLSGINEANAKFWHNQRQRAQERLTDGPVRETALEALHAEQLRQVPLFHRVSLEQALDDAERIGRRFLTAQARKGGTASKTDALQQLIEKIVAERQNISLVELTKKLEMCRIADTIEDIDEDTISFLSNGHSKQARLTGLKDRLSRARKKHRSR
jgi:hypothetical protein